MKKFALIGGVVIIGAVFLFFLPSDEVKNPINEEKPKVESLNKKNNYTLNGTNNQYKIKTSKELKTDKKPHIKTAESENQLNGFENKNYVIVDEIPIKRLNNFIEKKDLKLVSSVKNKNIQIYATNPPQKNDFAPPMPPVFVKLKFKNSNDVITIDSNVISANKKIYVVKKDADKAEVKEIDTKKIEDYMPPSIGQN